MKKIKELLVNFKLWAKENPMWGGIISTIAVGLPFALIIFVLSFLIPNNITHAIVSLVVFLVYMGSYFAFTKFMNKL